LAAGVLGVSIGLIVWLVVGLVMGLSIALNVQLIVGEGEVISAPALALALALAVVFALSFWARTAVDRAPPAERSTSPSQSYRNDLRRGAGISAMLVLLILVLGVLMIRGGPVDLDDWLTWLVLVGLLGGVVGGLTRPWFGFVIAATWYFLRRQRLPAPWRTMAMLEDTYRLGLLRTVGPVYQFRHRQLQFHLAPPTSGTPSRDETPSRKPLRRNT
jgi:hypothetical protein